MKPSDEDDKELKTAPELPDDLKPTEDSDTDSTDDKIPDAPKESDLEASDTDEDLNTGEEPPHQGRIKRFFRGYWHHKKWTLPLTFLLIVAIILVVPVTRYKVLGLALKRSYGVTIIDSKTNTPVSGAMVMVGNDMRNMAMTDSDGKATLKAKVGKTTVEISKKYYKTTHENIFVGISTKHNSDKVKLDATGRQVPLKVVNKITGKPVSGVDIKVLDTEAKTDSDGKATIVLPTSEATQPATLNADNYNKMSVKVEVTSKIIKANTFSITPAGKVYFLSNLSGKIDVVSSNLDGSNRQTVLAGTGTEDQNNTHLYHTKDWKYLALESKRDGGQSAKLFLINSNNGQLTTMDEGNATFDALGWSGHRFVYLVERTDVKEWQPKRDALKSYDADTGKITVIDQTAAEGSQYDYAYESINPFSGGSLMLLNDKILYAKTWQTYYGSENRYNGKKNQIITVNADGTDKRVLKSFALTAKNNGSIGFQQAKPDDVYIQVFGGSANTFYEYKNGNITQTNTITSDDFYSRLHSTYYTSPSDEQTLWSESRDGKNTLLVGDSEGENGKQIATLSDYAANDWYTNDYVLVSKNNTLYIMSVSGGTPSKISDYYGR